MLNTRSDTHLQVFTTKKHARSMWSKPFTNINPPQTAEISHLHGVSPRIGELDLANTLPYLLRMYDERKDLEGEGHAGKEKERSGKNQVFPTVTQPWQPFEMMQNCKTFASTCADIFLGELRFFFKKKQRQKSTRRDSHTSLFCLRLSSLPPPVPAGSLAIRCPLHQSSG